MATEDILTFKHDPGATKPLELLHLHKCHAKSLDLIDVANDFIDGNEHRKNFFGSEFKLTDRD